MGYNITNYQHAVYGQPISVRNSIFPISGDTQTEETKCETR